MVVSEEGVRTMDPVSLVIVHMGLGRDLLITIPGIILTFNYMYLGGGVPPALGHVYVCF